MPSPHTPLPDSTLGRAAVACIEEAESKLVDIHQVYADILKAAVESCKRNRVIISQDGLEAIMEAVSEELAHEADSSIETLRGEGFVDLPSSAPEKHKQMITDASEEIYGSFRPKKIDFTEAFKEAIRPGGVTQ